MFSFRQFRQIISVHEPVKVGLEEAVLDDTVFLEFGFGKFFGVVCGDAAGGIQYGVSAGIQEEVHTVCPVFHCHRDVAVGHALCQVQEGIDPLYTQFCSRVAVDGKIDLVLDAFVEKPSCGRVFVVVDGRASFGMHDAR